MYWDSDCLPEKQVLEKMADKQKAAPEKASYHASPGLFFTLFWVRNVIYRCGSSKLKLIGVVPWQTNRIFTMIFPSKRAFISTYYALIIHSGKPLCK